MKTIDDIAYLIRDFLHIPYDMRDCNDIDDLAEEVIATCHEATSVNDSLPDDGQRVLAHYAPDCWQVITYCEPSRSVELDAAGKERCCYVRDPFRGVDYWMELPTIPTESTTS